VALNLAGVGCGELARGMILATPGALRPVRRFNAWFSYGADPARPRRLKTPATVHLHHGTSEVMARLLLLGESGELAPGAAGFIQLRADEALAVRAGDRFIVRAGDPLYSIGGGVVLDTTPRLRTRLSEADRALLEALRDGEAPRSVRLALERSRVAVTSEQVATELGCERSEVTSVLNSCPETEVCRFKRDRETVWLSSAAAEQLRATIVETLRSWHEDNPQQTGLATGALCDLVCARQRTDPETFVLMLQQLEEAGTVTKAGGKVALASAAASVQATLDELCQRIAERVQGQGLSPEGPTALQAALGVERSLLAQALGILTREDRLIRLGGDLYFSPAAIEQAKDALTQALRRAPDGLTAAELRDVLGVSRKYAIPLLEHFDARGVTLRVGDLRQLR
ncbi:MAG: SelB C-terminal domain-containing protein, partial [Actinomycetia bacterium]|nr:SelB C-terminal domain-containing protein [Actinomycetes bacterium]